MHSPSSLPVAVDDNLCIKLCDFGLAAVKKRNKNKVLHSNRENPIGTPRW